MVRHEFNATNLLKFASRRHWLDFGIGSDEIKVESTAKLIEALEDMPKEFRHFLRKLPQTSVFDAIRSEIGISRVYHTELVILLIISSVKMVVEENISDSY